jgi:hypothetical protein
MAVAANVHAVDRLADLAWLLAHDRNGAPRIGREHLALALSAAAIGEALLQPAAVISEAHLLQDPVVARVVGHLERAAARDILQVPKVWLEYLAVEHERRELERSVVGRMIAAGTLRRGDRDHWQPLNDLVAAIPAGLLARALAGDPAASTPQVRMLAGICAHCGLADQLSARPQDIWWPLNQMIKEQSKPLRSVVLALEDAINDLALRRR